MADQPTNYDEWFKRQQLNSRLEGSGVDAVLHSACPFCGAPEMIVCKFSEAQAVALNGATCNDCGRSAKAILVGDGTGKRPEFVQTGGDDPPDFVPFKMRRV